MNINSDKSSNFDIWNWRIECVCEQISWYLPQKKSHPQPELCISWLNKLQQQQEYWWDNCHHLEQGAGALDCLTPANSALDHNLLGCQISGRSDSDIQSTGNVCSPESKINFIFLFNSDVLMLTNSTKLSLPEVQRCSAGQESCVLWNLKVHYHVYKNMAVDPILSQINLVYIFVPYFFKINFNIILSMCTYLFLSGLPTTILYAFLIIPCAYMLHPSHPPWCGSL